MGEQLSREEAAKHVEGIDKRIAALAQIIRECEIEIREQEKRRRKFERIIAAYDAGRWLEP